MAEDILITRTAHKVKSLDDVKLLNNQILVETITDNANATTEAGIIKTDATFWKNQFLAQRVNRVHRVVKTCEGLTFWSKTNKASGNCLRWRTALEVEVGDIVFSSYPSCVVYTAIICKGKEYKVLGYEELRLAQKPNGEYVPLNGFLVYRHPRIQRSSILIDPKPMIEFDKGEVVLCGKKNHSYIVGEKSWRDMDGNYEFKPGDIFVKSNSSHRLLLEDSMFNVYPEKNVCVIQRRDLLYVLK